MLFSQIVDLFHEQRAHFRRALDQILLIDHFERGESAGHRQIVAAERGRVNDAAVHPRKSFLVDFAPADDRARRHVTAAQRFRQRDDVRLQIPVLEPEHLAGPTETGLHFIRNQQRPIFAAKLLRAREEIALGCLATFTLDRLDHEPSHVARA